MKRRNAMRSKGVTGGFTLVELLVVISIIALLLSILMPALNQARGQGKKIQCMSKVRQIAMGFYVYGENNKGYFPCVVQPVDEGNGAYKPWWWMNLVGKYLNYQKTGNAVQDAMYAEFWLCPERKPNKDYARYGINDAGLGSWYKGWPAKAVRLASIPSPQKMIALADSDSITLAYTYISANPKYSTSYIYPRHNTRYFNAIFVDCHAESMMPQDSDILAGIKAGRYPMREPTGAFYPLWCLTDPSYWLRDKVR